MNRRGFLAVAGGGVILAVGAGIGGFIATRTPHKAYQPWRDAGSLYTEPRRKALSYAILAPNPHNRQPWLVDLSQAGRVILYVDTTRLLPFTDPFNRQIAIGFGCFLELTRMAAGQDGYRVDIELFPDGADDRKLDTRPVAIATFTKDSSVAPDPLFAFALARRSLKVPYDLSRPVSSDSLARIVSAVAGDQSAAGSNETALVEELRQITHDALVIEFETARTFKESVDLFRIGKAEIEANPDGIDLPGPLFEAMNLAGLLTRKATLDRDSIAYASGLKAVLDNADTAMAYVWLVSRTNARTEQIDAGRAWVRLNLAATEAGVGVQPLSQALQEYPEMLPLYGRTHSLLAPQGGTVQMLARLGYGAAAEPSPRWPLDTRLMQEPS